MLVVLVCLMVGVLKSAPVNKIGSDPSLWYLAMNLNPSDGHIMDYTTGWARDKFIGTYSGALSSDYLNRVIWGHPVSYIAIVRHHKGEVEAVKVFRFRESARSLLSRFQDMNPGREVVTEGGPLQEDVSKTAQNMADDPIFSVDGDLAFNWAYGNNGVRIVLTGGHLSVLGSNDHNTHGLGNHFAVNPHTGITTHMEWAHEISNIQGSGMPTVVQGIDHGSGNQYINGPVYGNYAIYVSEHADTFPGDKLDLEIEVEPKLKFF
ncbi:uncharacterized protein LOC134818173 [Bolinopsis microptera]|uniref:uncharacterized protein LOC134818173 n=1 Tax=Bolinopsis microptera TaxID=2820187 RepID=UPI00307AA546